MSRHVHIEDGFQKSVVVLEDDYVAVKVSYPQRGDRDLGIPDALMVYDALESHRLAEALIQAGMRMAGIDVDFNSCTRNECERNSWWSSSDGNEEFQ